MTDAANVADVRYRTILTAASPGVILFKTDATQPSAERKGRTEQRCEGSVPALPLVAWWLPRLEQPGARA
jgi:hypothetical protein